MLKPRSKEIRKPTLPDGICIYAVTDIHGCVDELRKVFAAIDHHLKLARPARPLHVFLGDYIDRGPASRETIDLLLDRSRRHESIFLRGNHEAMLYDVLRNPSSFSQWKEHGGLPTLMSYGIKPSLKPDREEQAALLLAFKRSIKPPHRQFFDRLRPKFLCGDFFFVHAGVKPGVSLARQKDDDLLWIRDEFLQSDANFGKYIVHGHTPVAKPDIRPNRINIDTGAFATGNLTLLTIQGNHMFAL
jgi:serine/threonine protein phosphatase 1